MVAARVSMDEISSGKLTNDLAFSGDDCCWAHIFGWGKTAESRKQRVATLKLERPMRHNFDTSEEYDTAYDDWMCKFSAMAEPQVTPQEKE